MRRVRFRDRIQRGQKSVTKQNNLSFSKSSNKLQIRVLCLKTRLSPSVFVQIPRDVPCVRYCWSRHKSKRSCSFFHCSFRMQGVSSNFRAFEDKLFFSICFHSSPQGSHQFLWGNKKFAISPNCGDWSGVVCSRITFDSFYYCIPYLDRAQKSTGCLHGASNTGSLRFMCCCTSH